MALKRKLRKLGILPGLNPHQNRINVPESLEIVQVRINVPESLEIVQVRIPEIKTKKTRKRRKTPSESVPKVKKE